MFIVIEGNDASGKSSLVQRISSFLRKQSIPTFLTFEPGAGNKDDEIRKIVLNTKNLSASQELIYFLQSRQQNNKQIANALAADKIVICDRYYYSSAVYQGYIAQHFPERYGKWASNGLSLDRIMSINHWLFPNFIPDIVIFLSCPAEITIKRFKSSQKKTNFIDDFSEQYHTSIYEGYQELYRKLSNSRENENVKYYLINALLTKNEIFKQVRDAILIHASYNKK